MTPAPPPLVVRRLRALVFDLDGTLVDSYRAISRALDHARAAFGLPPVGLPELTRSVGHGLESLIERYVGTDRVEEGVRLFRQRYGAIVESETRALPGARETVQALRARGFGLAVASNKPTEFTERIVASLGLLPCMAAVLGPERAGAPKPDPAMIRLALSALAVRPDEAAYVGDMVLDVESAARAGVASILVTGGSSDEEELRRTGQTVVVGLAALLDLLPERAPSR